MNNPYNVLGVAPGSTQEDIKSAYRKLAKEWHPDINKSAEADLKFKEITAAYESLKNKTRFTHNTSANEDMFANFRDIFSQHFGHRYNQPRYDVYLSLEQVFFGTEITINHNGKNVKIPLPNTLSHGEVVQLQIDNEHILVVVYFREHHAFHVRQHDLITVVEVDILDILTGYEITLETIDNQKIKVKIPENFEDQQLLFAGKYGLNTRSGNRGAFYVAVKHVFPKLTDDQKEILEKVKNEYRSK